MRAEDRVEAGRIPLFRGLAADRVDALLRHAAMHRHPRGALLFEEGTSADLLHLLVEGSVELFTRAGGADAAIAIVWPLESFFLAAALTGEPHLASARTLAASRILAIPAAAVREEVHADRRFAVNAMALLAAQFRMAIRQIKDLKTRTGPQRLAAFLIRLVDETGANGEAELPISKAVLASRLGMTPESLSRALSMLKAQGLHVRGARVRLTDRARLEQYCVPNALIDAAEGPLDIVREENANNG